MASKLIVTAIIFLLTSCTGATPTLPGKLKNLTEQRLHPKCLPASEISKGLFTQFRELLTASAVLQSAPSKMLVLFYGSNSGSFTVTLTGKNKISCAILWGSDYYEVGR